MPTIDRTSYPKARRPIGCGYDRRVKGISPRRALIHSTNGARGSTLRSEALYLLNSNAVGTHYIVGKRGEIIEELDPALRAWHAGRAIAGWGNNDTTGIECHHAVGEAWTPEQRDALTWLVRDHLGIAPADIETHRAVALPHGRKVDPSDWSDADFYAWRASLGAHPPLPDFRRFQIHPDLQGHANVRQAWWTRWPQNGKEVPIAMQLDPGAIIYVDTVKNDGTPVDGDPRWVHMARVPGVQVDAGFVAEALGVWL